jgi:hypothetical protein
MNTCRCDQNQNDNETLCTPQARRPVSIATDGARAPATRNPPRAARTRTQSLGARATASRPSEPSSSLCGQRYSPEISLVPLCCSLSSYFMYVSRLSDECSFSRCAVMLITAQWCICGKVCSFLEQVPGVAPNKYAPKARKFSCVPSWRLGQDQAAPDPFAPTTQKTAPQQRVSSASHVWNVTLHGTADMDSTLTPGEQPPTSPHSCSFGFISCC